VLLRKPLYLVPTPGWFERYHNASIVQKLGLGIMEEKPTAAGLKQFFKNLGRYRESLKKSSIRPSNEEFTKKLEEVIAKLTKK